MCLSVCLGVCVRVCVCVLSYHYKMSLTVALPVVTEEMSTAALCARIALSKQLLSGPVAAVNLNI